MKIAVLPGDGIGPEIVAAGRARARRARPALRDRAARWSAARPTKRTAIRCPMPRWRSRKAADAVLFGAVGDWKYDTLERALRPEQAILGLRKALGLFANFRPAICYPATHRRLEPEAGDRRRASTS